MFVVCLINWDSECFCRRIGGDELPSLLLYVCDSFLRESVGGKGCLPFILMPVLCDDISEDIFSKMVDWVKKLCVFGSFLLPFKCSA